MGLPQINVAFTERGIAAVKRSQKGIVAIMLRDKKSVGKHILKNVTEIPKDITVKNKWYVETAFLGYQSPPRQVILYIIDEVTETLEDALEHFATVKFDYLVGFYDITAEESAKIASWIKSERLNDHYVKAVLPNLKADSEAIVNFTADEIEVGKNIYMTSEYCARIAGLIAGTPMTMSSTYAPLPEVTDVKRYKKEELDEKIDKGEFVLFHNGEKVLVGRGVNSLVTTGQDKGNDFKKIKIVEVMDMIKHDIRVTAHESYIGKYNNSYDNKCLLVVAIKGYLQVLEREDILERGRSEVLIDIERHALYLNQKGIDTSDMTEQQLKEADTDSNVFLMGDVGILDAIEDIAIIFSM